VVPPIADRCCRERFRQLKIPRVGGVGPDFCKSESDDSTCPRRPTRGIFQTGGIAPAASAPAIGGTTFAFVPASNWHMQIPARFFGNSAIVSLPRVLRARCSRRHKQRRGKSQSGRHTGNISCSIHISFLSIRGMRSLIFRCSGLAAPQPVFRAAPRFSARRRHVICIPQTVEIDLNVASAPCAPAVAIKRATCKSDLMDAAAIAFKLLFKRSKSATVSSATPRGNFRRSTSGV